MIDVSVVVVNWNSKKFLQQCLSSVFKCVKQVQCEVLVIDNGSFDGAAELIRTTFPDVHFIQNTANVGFGAANNICFEKSQGRYILLLNPDTTLQEDAISPMVAFLELHPEFGLVGCRIEREDGSVDFNGGRKLPSLWSEITMRLRLNKLIPGLPFFSTTLLEHWDHKTSREVEVFSGACMMLRREAFQQLGGFDPNIFMYAEDIDLCHRLRKSGWKTWYLGETHIVHLGGKSTSQQGLSMIVEGVRSMKYYYAKHYGALYAFAYSMLVFVGSFIQLFVQGLAAAFGLKAFSRTYDAHRAILKYILARR